MDPFRVRPSAPDDARGLAALAAQSPMRGMVTVATVPGPRGDDWERFVAPRMVWVAEGAGGNGAPAPIVGSISLGRRTTRLAGRPLCWGYLGDLRVAPRSRRQGVAMQLAAAIAAEERRCDSKVTAFATLGGNRAVEALIQREQLPRARPLARMRLVYWLTLREPPVESRRRARPARPADLPDIWRLLDRHWRDRALAPSPSLDEFAAEWTRDPSFCLDDAVVVERGGCLVACGALWDQRPLRQELVLGYRLPLTVVAGLVRVWAALRKAPRLPRAGQAIPLAFLRHFAADDVQAGRAVRDALLARARARGLAIVAGGFDRRDPLGAVASGGIKVEMASTAWAVGTAVPDLDHRPVLLDYSLI